MPERLTLEEEVRALARKLEALSARLDQVERTLRSSRPRPGPTAPPRPAAVEESGMPPEAAEVLRGVSSALPHVGRLLLVLGGAYLLRAITEDLAATAARLPGVAAGLVYAFSWLWLADRAARRGRRLAAVFRGLACALIAYPLVWETTARFHLVSPPIAGVLVGATGVSALVFAGWFRFRSLAWIFTVGSVLCALGLIVPEAASVLPQLLALLAVGATALFVGRTRSWLGLALFALTALDLACVIGIYHAVVQGVPAPEALLALLFLQFVLYAATTCYGLLVLRRAVDAFDVAATTLAGVVGVGGALYLARATTTAVAGLSLGILAVAAAAYLFSFTVLDRARRGPFYYLTTLALLLVFLASAVLLEEPAWPWAVVAVLMVLLSRKYGRTTLGVHATLYAWAAVSASGLLVNAESMWLSPSGGLGSGPSPAGWAALVATGLAAALPVRGQNPARQKAIGIAQLLVLALLAWAAGGVVISLVAGALPSDHAGLPDAAWLATLRTAVLAGLAFLTAAAGRRPNLEVAGGLLPALLAAGGLKLALEDLPHGTATSLAMSFAIYGTVLTLAPRLRSPRSRAPIEAAPSAEPPPNPEPSHRAP